MPVVGKHNQDALMVDCCGALPLLSTMSASLSSARSCVTRQMTRPTGRRQESADANWV